MDARQLAGTFDHTLLKADSDSQQVKALCEEARSYSFASVCVLPTHVHTAFEALEGSSVAVCTVVGFPLGSSYSAVKAHETREAIARGATEIDMVMNIGAFKNGAFDDVLYDIEEVVEVAYSLGSRVKVIIETCLLTEDEKKRACDIVTASQADFIKTSTGFSSGGATVEDVKLLRTHVGEEVLVKASGGIRTLEQALLMIDAGAARIGASASVQIMKEFLSRQGV